MRAFANLAEGAEFAAMELFDMFPLSSRELRKASITRAFANVAPDAALTRRDLESLVARAARDMRDAPIDFGDDRRPARKAAGPSEMVDFLMAMPIIKRDAEQRLVTGIVLEPTKEMGQPDSQGDLYSAAEVEQAALRFMENYQQLGLQHQEMVGRDCMRIVESWIQPDDTVIGGQPVVKGTWLMTVRVVDDQLWKDIREGRLTGFSIGGSATRTPVTRSPSFAATT
jgi:hypothetical protein